MAAMLVTSEAGLRDWARRRPRAQLLLDMAALTRDENDVWAKTINHLRSECGCSAGAATLVIMAIAYPAVMVLGNYHVSERLSLELVAGLLCTIAAAGFAKAIAVLWARQRMHGAISTLAALVAARHIAIIQS